MATVATTISTSLLFLVLLHSATSLPEPHSPNQDAATAFIDSSCAATLYPILCRASLSAYASSIRRDPVQLAAAAANVTLIHIRSVSAYVSAISRSSFSAAAASPGSRSVDPRTAAASPGSRSVDPRTAAALRDCAETLSGAEYLAGKSAAELAKLSAAEGPDIALYVGDAQTWLSAALTNEETCIDGFKAAESSGGGAVPVTVDVVARVGQAKQYTSNALALVNLLVAHSR